MNFRSHSKKEIQEAQKHGKKIWMLDTGTYGEDDMLIGEKEEVFGDILCYYEIEKLPDGWTLEEIDWEI